MWRQRFTAIKQFSELLGLHTKVAVVQGIRCARISNSRIQHWFRTRAEQFFKDKADSGSLIWPYMRKNCSVRKPVTVCLAACAFKWQDNGVNDKDIDSQVMELLTVQKILQRENYHGYLPNHWEAMVSENDIKMWRYPKDDNSELMEYKIFGTFSDISARMFFNIQLDNDYRKHWDDLVMKLETIDENRSKNEIVVRWVTRFPYPFSHREYVFVRRAVINDKDNTMVISSRAVEHPSCPTNSKYVRVSCYTSHMVIKPHKSYDDLGFDYLMTYCDDPQIVLPSSLSSWVLSQGIPEYIKKVHDACLNFGSLPGTPTIANYSC